MQERRHKRGGFDSLVGKIPWERKWQPKPMPVFLLGVSHGQRSLAGYSPQCHKESVHDWSSEWMKCLQNALMERIVVSALPLLVVYNSTYLTIVPIYLLLYEKKIVLPYQVCLVELVMEFDLLFFIISIFFPINKAPSKFELCSPWINREVGQTLLPT